MPSTDSEATSCSCTAGYRLDGPCSASPAGTFKEAVGNTSTDDDGCAQVHGCCRVPAAAAVYLSSRSLRGG
jgi:hypothetical protein